MASAGEAAISIVQCAQIRDACLILPVDDDLDAFDDCGGSDEGVAVDGLFGYLVKTRTLWVT